MHNRYHTTTTNNNNDEYKLSKTKTTARKEEGGKFSHKYLTILIADSWLTTHRSAGC